jgi:hypothetical protein
MKYQQAKNSTNIIIRIDDQGIVSAIPNDPSNADWQAYQAWLAQGNQPLPPQ